jgi:hypothetical protein
MFHRNSTSNDLIKPEDSTSSFITVYPSNTHGRAAVEDTSVFKGVQDVVTEEVTNKTTVNPF